MTYKQSHYTVITDPVEDISGKRIIYATRTSKALTISGNLYKNLINQEWDQIPAEAFEKLISCEAIVSSDENELETVVGRNKTAINKSRGLYYVIQPTAMCQLGCGYCGQNHTKDYISTSASAKILARIQSKLEAKPHNSLGIAWFGSEPLMGLSQIRELSPKLIDLANKYNCRYSGKVVTNGLSLKEPIFVELVTKHKINKIEVTLDGTAEFHDARRHTKDGISTFDLILDNLIKIYNRPDFKELGCGLSIRCNVDARNHLSVVPLLQTLAKHNLQDKIEYFYVAPIHSWGNDAHLLSLSKDQFADMEIDWLLEEFKLGFHPGLLPGLKSEVCLSVNPEAEVVDAFGNIFDCTEVPYVPAYEGSEYLLGNINNHPDTISKNRTLLNFNDEILSGSLPCSTCEMLPVCGGACPKSWKENVAPCPANKFNIKDKLKLHYAIKKKGKDKVLAVIN